MLGHERGCMSTPTVAVENRTYLNHDRRKARCTLHVCTSCRPSGTPREPKEQRPGFRLYEELDALIEANQLHDLVDVVPTACLSVCPRPCGIALSRAGAWTYIFGDQQPTETTASIVECIATYIASPDGAMARQHRPMALRASILGRVPPLKEGKVCT